MAEPVVRFFTLAMPGGGLGFDYLTAIDRTTIGVRACPIGFGHFTAAPWDDIAHLFFVGQMSKQFVNVVCAPPNLNMGRSFTASEVKPQAGAPLPKRSPGRDSDDVVYQPQTALSGLFTVGVPNIAITLPKPRAPQGNDVTALQRYDAVICPTAADADALVEHGVTAFHIPPDPPRLAKLISWFMP